ncbi:MAG: class I mannose-6-phosphate isomerase [Ruminococcaceae bacterium]|nr:class I mannose-6-phosphate isomerase [Oscillospiraceae bacterium]
MDHTPIKLSPAFKDYIWGGDKLIKEFGKKSDSEKMEKIAESWELSAHKDGESKVADGPFKGLTLSEYISAAGKDVLGSRSLKYSYFPLLIKLIDAKADLSVQVHPDDEYALTHEGEYGKTEMWYIIDCEEGASLYYGFERDITKEEYEKAIEDGKLCDLLRKVDVKKGDVFFIPAKTVHAIGAGLFICEIQQNSNTTYRVFDYNRRDKNGNLRPLHIEKALEVSSLKRSSDPLHTDKGDDVLLAECEYFSVRKLTVNNEAVISSDTESFVSLLVTEGTGKLIYNNGEISLSKGDSIFIPAADAEYKLIGQCELIASKVN